LADNSTAKHPRLIDGIVLTKFDTIDDKVGAAISMTYSTGQPIVFVGVGQKYQDLKKLNVKSIIKSLMK
jgi:signal recognition particle receptor subunit alpha